MIIKRYTIFCFYVALLLTSCTQKKDKLIQTFDVIYQDVLDLKFENIETSLNGKSLEFHNKITNLVYLNIDSIIVLGKEYKIPYMLTEYLALNGDKIKDGKTEEEFYRFLGAQDISFFSFSNAFYVDKPKLKKGKENFVAIIKEEMTLSKRTWVNFHGSKSTGYKLNLLYTLQLEESKSKSHFKLYHKASNSELSFEDYLRYYYWQNSGKNSSRFETDMLNLEKSKREARAETILSYENRGLKDKTRQSN
ncbi:MAG: hypothetical protein ACI86M_001991 [Saprospiraceae bacterium]|jgi:hypothetical protein